MGKLDRDPEGVLKNMDTVLRPQISTTIRYSKTTDEPSAFLSV